MTSPFDRSRLPVGFTSVPGWPLAVRCVHPDVEDGDHYDICLTGVMCEAHTRTAYYCHETGEIWCDGYLGSDRFEPHKMIAIPEKDQ